jgi:hypothetical protein
MSGYRLERRILRTRAKDLCCYFRLLDNYFAASVWKHWETCVPLVTETFRLRNMLIYGFIGKDDVIVLPKTKGVN